MRIEQAVARQLGRVGIPLRFVRDFLGDSSRWGRTQVEDFFGDERA